MEDKTKVPEIVEVFNKINAVFLEFQVESATQVAGHRGCHKAGAKSRKLSMELGALLKEWRRVSVAAHRDDDAE